MFRKYRKYWTIAGGKYWTLCKQMSEQTHLLIAGTTGSGKSVLVKSFIYSMLAMYAPSQMQFVFIDCKGGCELGVYKHLPHSLGVATTVGQAESYLEQTIQLMERRFCDMERNNMRETDENHIWVVIDETAVLLSESKLIEKQLAKIMRLGRAAHIHTLLCTQSPNRTKGGGLSPIICQNVTSAIALRCRSAVESRQIIGVGGAEKLPVYGQGMFWSPSGINTVHIPMTDEGLLNERIHEWEIQ